uniref:ATPase expression protein 2, mitochondrial n=1 Tax=Plectus sambesii TaxID=2011161 RepID=A0A914VQI3_9BILA
MIRRNFATQSFVIRRILFNPTATTSERPWFTTIRRQLLSTATDNCNAGPQFTSTNHFRELDRTVQNRARSKFPSHWDLLKMQSKMFKFTADRWHVYLCAFSALGQIGQRAYFQHNDSTAVTRMVEAMAKCLDRFEPIDYFNFIRFLESRSFSYEDASSSNIQGPLCKWFIKYYSQLEPSAFFEILMAKACWLEQNRQLGTESEADVLKFLEHGTNLATQSAEISAALRMIHVIELYSIETEGNEKQYSALINSLLQSLAGKVLPSSQSDLFATLSFITGLHERPIKFRGIRPLRTSHVFQRYSTGDSRDDVDRASTVASPAAGWQWLRNSIELPFGSDDLSHLRQLAAFAAVEAYRSGTVDFSADDIERFLYKASEPFLMNPAVLFEPIPSDIPTMTRIDTLKILLMSLYAALDCDPDQLGVRLRASSIRFDYFYWERFDNMLRTQIPNLKPEQRPLVLDSIIKSLSHLNPGRLPTQKKLHKVVYQKDKMVVAKPIITPERRKFMELLKIGSA